MTIVLKLILSARVQLHYREKKGEWGEYGKMEGGGKVQRLKDGKRSGKNVENVQVPPTPAK